MKEEALKLADELDKMVLSDDWGDMAKYYGWFKENASPMIRKLVDKLEAYERLAEASQIASPPPKKKPISRTDLYGLAMQSGFMLSTQYGQDDGKMMPATDGDTLVKLARAIEERHGIK